METLQLIAMWVIGLGIYNVWLLRSAKSTAYRGGQAENMREEFEVYGLPRWFMTVIGGVKLALATAIIIGTWVPALVVPATSALGVLMIGAIAMHIKVGDTFKKTAPATAMALLCGTVVFISLTV